MIFMLLLLSASGSIFGQFMKRIDFIAGYGFYEDVHAGLRYNFSSGTHSAGLTAGYDNFLQKGSEYSAFSMDFNTAFKRQRILSDGSFAWWLDNSILWWRLEDPYYRWSVISLIPAIERHFRISSRIGLSAAVGPAFNIILHSYRKTYFEAGWPYHVLPDVRIILIL